MDQDPPDPDLACDPLPGGGAACALTEAAAAARARHCAMLGDLAEVGMVLTAALRRQVEATGRCGPEEAASYEIVTRAVRRSVALREKLLDQSGMTEEARATAAAAQEAVAAKARLAERTDRVRLALERNIEVEVKGRGLGASDRERLLADLHERLGDAVIARASTREDERAIIEGICKDLEITPRKETWSDVALEAGIADTTAQLQRVAEQFSPSAAAAAAVAARANAPAQAPASAPVEEPLSPSVTLTPEGLRKIGRFTFGPDGSVVAQEPMEPGIADWAEQYQRKRDPPDTG